MELLRLITTLISTTVLILGVGFTVAHLRHLRANRRRGAMLEMVHRLQTPDFARAMRALFEIRGDPAPESVNELVRQDPGLIYELMATWESLGILVYRGEVSLAMVDDFFSGPILISWDVLSDFVQEERSKLGRATIWEWFQWLAERMAERERDRPPVPAYLVYR